MVELPQQDAPFDEAQLAAAAFLARYSGRTLDAYRHDLRILPVGVGHRSGGPEVGSAHIELYRCSMEARGLAASTIDRRLSTVCGFYRFAHIDGRIAATPPSTSDGPRLHRARATAWTAAS
ncbi:MAG: site-specific integrase [Actinomycetota bacterium]|nr:site-specific integrase [Actinomycetota bacterium]